MDTSVRPEIAAARKPAGAPIPKVIEQDLARLKNPPKSQDQAIADLLGLFEGESAVDVDDLIYPV